MKHQIFLFLTHLNHKNHSWYPNLKVDHVFVWLFYVTEISELDSQRVYIEPAKFYIISYQYLRKFQLALSFKSYV